MFVDVKIFDSSSFKGPFKINPRIQRTVLHRRIVTRHISWNHLIVQVYPVTLPFRRSSRLAALKRASKQTWTSISPQCFSIPRKFMWYREPAIVKQSSEALAAVLLPGGTGGVNRAIVDADVAAQK